MDNYNIKAILFDLDGTLLDSLDVTIAAFRKTFSRFLKQEITEEFVFSQFGGPEQAIFSRVFQENYTLEIFNYYFDYYTKNIEKIKVHDQISELLNSIKNKYSLGIYTARSRKLTNYLVNYAEIGKFFKITIAGDEVKNCKPHGDGVKKFSKEINIMAQNIIYIGDTEKDIQTSLDSSSIPALAAWDKHIEKRQNYKELIARKDIILLNKPLDLLNYL